MKGELCLSWIKFSSQMEDDQFVCFSMMMFVYCLWSVTLYVTIIFRCSSMMEFKSKSKELTYLFMFDYMAHERGYKIFPSVLMVYLYMFMIIIFFEVMFKSMIVFLKESLMKSLVMRASCSWEEKMIFKQSEPLSVTCACSSNVCLPLQEPSFQKWSLWTGQSYFYIPKKWKEMQWYLEVSPKKFSNYFIYQWDCFSPLDIKIMSPEIKGSYMFSQIKTWKHYGYYSEFHPLRKSESALEVSTWINSHRWSSDFSWGDLVNYYMLNPRNKSSFMGSGDLFYWRLPNGFMQSISSDQSYFSGMSNGVMVDYSSLPSSHQLYIDKNPSKVGMSVHLDYVMEKEPFFQYREWMMTGHYPDLESQFVSLGSSSSLLKFQSVYKIMKNEWYQGKMGSSRWEKMVIWLKKKFKIRLTSPYKKSTMELEFKKKNDSRPNNRFFYYYNQGSSSSSWGPK